MKYPGKLKVFFKPIIILFIVFFYGCKFNASNEDSESEKTTVDTASLKVNSNKTLEIDNTDNHVSETFTSSQDTLFDFVGKSSEGLTLVEKNGFYGFIDDKSKIVITLTFDDAQPFSEGLAAVKQGEKWGYINKKGNFVIEPTYDIATSFNEGLAAVRNNFVWGYINNKNKHVIDFKYDFAYPFLNGKAQVMKGTTWYTINKRGKEIDRNTES
ncbi:WG repeat-containing protein [Chondrinema litorale]|uniref:WG repeat-containing protein n=1 Tax=Chondrinema litorale TaxID=2994555 RepID=UPI002543CCE9|nr:WG repeat-containing protein [Chondrinema litorale]UZR93497.1 WG repeat-containing protein [Chondrinema litorale]